MLLYIYLLELCLTVNLSWRKIDVFEFEFEFEFDKKKGGAFIRGEALITENTVLANATHFFSMSPTTLTGTDGYLFFFFLVTELLLMHL